MDKAAKTQFEKQTIKYIENKKIYDVLENLLRKLVLYQPNDPIDFLIDHLTNKKPNFVISVIGIETDIHKICGNISPQLNLKHISIESVITKEIQSNSNLGKELKEIRAQNKKIPDEKVHGLLLNELKSVDKFVNGVLLENFPVSLRQAECLKLNKTVIDRIFTISEETIEEKIAQKKITHELLDIKEVLEAFEGFTVPIDAKNKTNEKISEEIVTMLNYRVKHSIPLRPPRILIINPPGFAFEKIGAQIAQKFGLVHIDGTVLLNREVDQKTRIGGIIADCFKNNDLVPDDLLCGLVYNELTKSTSRVLGWVLTTFPLNSAQFHKYLSWELHPHFVLHVQYKESEFTKNLLENADLSKLNYFGQVFVNKCRKSKEFFNEQIKNGLNLKTVVDEVYSNKTETLEPGTTGSQISAKIAKLLENPVFYE